MNTIHNLSTRIQKLSCTSDSSLKLKSHLMLFYASFKFNLKILHNARDFDLLYIVYEKPIYFNTNYRTETKLVQIMDYCLLHFDALKFP